MSKDKQKVPDDMEEEFEEEMNGPRKSAKGKARSDSAESEHRGPPTAFYLHSLLLVGGRLLHMVLDAYNSLFDLKPEDKATIYRNLSTQYINKGLYDKALEHLQEWVQLEPSNAQAQYQLGIALAAAGKNERAIGAFDAALKIKPKLKGALYRKSTILLRTKDFALAAKGFESMVKVTPDDARAHYLLGISYDGLSEIDKAIEAVQQAVDLNPKEIKYQQHLGFLNVRKDDHKTAARHFTKVMELEREMEENDGEY